MNIARTVSEVRKVRLVDPTLSWGLVPTMGYLHEGHLSLVRRARTENHRVAVSIFVNPTQFAPYEDLDSYPQDLERDLSLLIAEDIDLLFLPSEEVIYPPDFQTEINVKRVSQPLEGRARPTHFQGVATIVAKLFNIIEPTHAYFGQKDAQQTAVLRQLVRDLNFNLKMIICPTKREADGLAMSSRNKYLSANERIAAPVLFYALSKAKEAYKNGERNGDVLRDLMTECITAVSLAKIDYVSVADLHTLEELNQIEGDVLLSTAVTFGNTRLIDNIIIYQ